MRSINLCRTEAESLVDLLEEADPREVGLWRVVLADGIREQFGMIRTLDAIEAKMKEEDAKKNNED